MNPLTPTQEHTVYVLAAEMMARAASDGDRTRIDRAMDLVSQVERMARPDLFLVTSQSTADAAYRVHQGQCNCPDASRRDARRCKHAVAVELFKQAERLDAEQSDPTPLTIRVDPEDSILDLWPTEGEHPDLPAQCSRCHAEAASLRHRDGLGARCIARELFGAEV